MNTGLDKEKRESKRETEETKATLLCLAGTLGGTFPGKGRLMWGVDKRGGIGVGEGALGDVIPSVEPLRSQAGVNMAGPPTFDRKAGSQRKKGDELGVIIGRGKRVEREDVHHFNVILLLNSITEMMGRVVGEGLQKRPTGARVVFRLWKGGVDSGSGGGAVNGRQDMVGGNSRSVGWMDE
jgi:hypothetical protein